MQSISERIDEILANDITVEDLDKEINRTTARLAVLQTLRQQIDIVAAIIADKPMKLPAPKPKKEPKPPAVSPPAVKTVHRDSTKLAFDIGSFLKTNGPKRRDAIQNAFSLTYSEFDAVLQASAWFEKDNGMYTLSGAGHSHFNEELSRKTA